MLDLCDPECLWTGYDTFNETVQRTVAFSLTGKAMRQLLRDNLEGWYA